VIGLERTSYRHALIVNHAILRREHRHAESRILSRHSQQEVPIHLQSLIESAIGLHEGLAMHDGVEIDDFRRQGLPTAEGQELTCQ